MSYAIDTNAPGAVSTYLGLVDEIRDLSDNANYSQAVIDRALRKAEARFNRELRTTPMETRLIFQITEELTALPTDFLEMRSIFQEGSPDSPLVSMSPAGLLTTYMGQGGTPCAYAIEGNRIRIGPVGTTNVEMVYYRSIPALTDQSVSNWLLLAHPDLYVAAVMQYVALREVDNDALQKWSAIAGSFIEDINRSSQSARWGAGPLSPAGIVQVIGARA